ncbi:MAG: type II toxin-antitoxin system RelE/ParE family toxin [Candidatus Nealsonbacteria bacterium]|nr:type II toxin-antitoxin system RelE/ParE family toxin [Candidatus Nealsonbacteria bacterium]
MPQIVRTSRAELDLAEIWTYIAEDNPEAADRLIRRVDERLRLLLVDPTMGECMEHYRRGLRATAVGNYVIYYSPTEGGIEVYRVLHAARQREDHL